MLLKQRYIQLTSGTVCVLQDGIQKVAEPIGIIAGIVPTTNPTSTVIFKCLLALKTRSVLTAC
jgi:acyl-CoA reductase-like NAD-dependent aldehyde dehydrogenase